MIPTESQIKFGHYRLIDGIWNKRCAGPAHEEHVWLPANDKYFYFRKTGRPVSQCRLCHAWVKVKSPGSHHGYIEMHIARPYYQEAVNRIGMTELSKRTGLSLHHVQTTLNKPAKKYVQKLSLRKVMLELVSIHRKNEYLNSPRVKWQTQRRNTLHRQLCAACGIEKDDATRGCITCRTRHYDRFKKKQITKKEWERLKNLMEDRNE